MDLIEADWHVRQLHARYADAVWRRDLDAFAACFTATAEWRIAGRELCGRDAICAFMARVFKTFDRVFMTFRTPIVHIANGRIGARTYVTEQNVLREGHRPIAPMGTYFEWFEEDAGTLKLAWRLFQTNYSGPADLSGLFPPFTDYGPPPAMPPLDARVRNVSGVLSLHTAMDNAQ